MRKVSTSTDLACPYNDEDMKPTLIYVKPIATIEQISFHKCGGNLHSAVSS